MILARAMSRQILRYAWLLVWALASCIAADGAQIPGLPTSGAAATATPAAAAPTPDPLGRENPRGTVLGFIKNAQEEKWKNAIRYFEPPKRRGKYDPADEEELAAQLIVLLNQKFAGTMDFISRDPKGKLDDGLPEDQERVGNILGTDSEFPVLLVRREDDEGRELWYFSRETLDKVPDAYETLSFPEIEKKIPQVLVRNRILSMPLWQWLAFVLFVPIALLAARMLSRVFELGLYYYRKARHLPLGKLPGLLYVGPITLALAVLIHYWFVSAIGTSLYYRLYYRKLIWVLLAIAFYWILTKVTRSLSHQIAITLTTRGMLAERSIVSLTRRFAEVVIFLVVSMVVLQSLGVNVSALVAGVGIGGLALGLGAQKTLENMFGGVSVLFDKVIQIGDVCKINNQVGTVEDIGLRSTRLRTPERTLLTIPNGVMASATIENLRFRDKFLCQQTIRLRYDLSPSHVKYVLGQIWELLLKNPKIEESTARVRFLRFSDYSLDIEIYAYIQEPDYNLFLETQEKLLLQIMDRLEEAGAVVALPTQTTLVTQDGWIDAGKKDKAEHAIEKARDIGKRDSES